MERRVVLGMAVDAQLSCLLSQHSYTPLHSHPHSPAPHSESSSEVIS